MRVELFLPPQMVGCTRNSTWVGGRATRWSPTPSPPNTARGHQRLNNWEVKHVLNKLIIAQLMCLTSHAHASCTQRKRYIPLCARIHIYISSVYVSRTASVMLCGRSVVGAHADENTTPVVGCVNWHEPVCRHHRT